MRGNVCIYIIVFLNLSQFECFLKCTHVDTVMTTRKQIQFHTLDSRYNFILRLKSNTGKANP